MPYGFSEAGGVSWKTTKNGKILPGKFNLVNDFCPLQKHFLTVEMTPKRVLTVASDQFLDGSIHGI